MKPICVPSGMKNESDPDFVDVTHAMIVYGGSFVQHLGRLFRVADTENRLKLAAAFPEYWEKYRNVATVKLRKTL